MTDYPSSEPARDRRIDRRPHRRDGARALPQAKPAVAAGVIALLLIGSILGFDLWRTYSHLEEQAFGETSSLATVFESDVLRDMAAADGMLKTYAERVKAHDAQGGIVPAQIEDEARLLLQGLPASGLGFAGPDGKLVAATWIPVITDFSDAPYFRQIVDNPPSDKPVIAALQIAKATNQWVIPMTRGVYRDDGSLIGIVGATLAPDQFVAPFAGIDTGKFTAVTLFQDDGTVIARAPHGPDLVGRSAAGSDLFSKFLPAADRASVRYHGVFLGKDLVMSYRRLPGTPFIIAASFDGAEVFRPWIKLFGIYAVLGLALSLAIAGCTWLVTRDQARRQALAAAGRVRAIIDGMSGFIALFSVEGDILDINRAPIEGTKIVRADLLGRPLWRTGWCGYSDASEAKARSLIRRAASGERVREDLVVRVGPDLYRTLDVTLQPIEEADGNRYIVGSGVDVTEQRRLAEQFRQSQKMEALGLLAGGIAHDFNNLLASMSHFAQFLAEDLDPASPQHGFADRLCRACNQGKEIVAQILTYARPDAVERAAVEIVAIVRDLCEIVQSSKPPEVVFEFDLPEDARCIVFANGAQLTQILLNLCVNAIDAVSQGQAVEDGTKGTVRLALDLAEPGHKPLSADRAEAAAHYRSASPHPGQRYACVCVRDTGPGIDHATLQRIFDPFFTTKTRGRGTGLGLAVVHSIVNSLGGLIEVASTPGEGATFAIYLPLTEQPAPIAAESQPPAAVAGEERILIVEDDADVADGMAIGLERAGYEVVVATDADEALQLVRELPDGWGAMIVDHRLPNRTGSDLVREIRAISPGIPAILHTGDVESVEPDQRSGIEALLQKPVDPARLAATVRAVLDHAALDHAAPDRAPLDQERQARPSEAASS
jgi:PAS domain S-box-containing protein